MRVRLSTLLLVGAIAIVGFFLWRMMFFGNRPDRARPGQAAVEEDDGDDPTHMSESSSPRSPEDIEKAISAVLPQAADEGAPTEEPVYTDEEEPPQEPRKKHWLVEFFTPKPGEDLIAYRDRVLPVVQAAVHPQRVRVKRWREEFEREANLDDTQKRVLDESVAAAGDAIKDRLLSAVLSGEFAHPKAMTGIRMGNEILQTVIGADDKFRASLSPEQVQMLDDGRFDVADYLFFSTRWEDLLGVEE